MFSQRVLYDQWCMQVAGTGSDRRVGEAIGSAVKGGEDKKRKGQAKKHKKN